MKLHDRRMQILKEGKQVGVHKCRIARMGVCYVWGEHVFWDIWATGHDSSSSCTGEEQEIFHEN